MINKRLIGTVPESKRYVAGNVILQWCSLLANIAMMTAITRLLAALYLNAADGAPVTLSDEGAKLLSTALELSAATNGAYDPTVAPLTDLWGIGTDHQKVPSQSEIDAALQTVGTAHVHENGDAVTLDSGSKIDLGGIAKGYAADLCADILKSADADGLLVLGGNIYAVGTNEGKDWNIGIADPDEPTDTVAAVAVHDLSVVTSGDYERYFEQDGSFRGEIKHIENAVTADAYEK